MYYYMFGRRDADCAAKWGLILKRRNEKKFKSSFPSHREEYIYIYMCEEMARKAVVKLKISNDGGGKGRTGMKYKATPSRPRRDAT